MKNERYDTIVIPDCLSQRVRKGIRQGEKIYMRNRRKKVMMRIVAAAAAMLVCVGIFASQPALASKVPIIRNIFKLLQGDYSYQGDLDAAAQKLKEDDGEGNGNPKETGQDGAPSGEHEGADGKEEGGTDKGSDGAVQAADMAYTKTVDGVTVSISEAYSSVEAIYLSLMINSEEAFPDTMTNMDENPLICLKGKVDYSFMPAGRGEAQGYANGGTGSVEGKFLDDHTYAGIYRIDIMDIAGNDEELKEKYRGLDAFDMSYTIEQIIGDKAEPEPLDYRGKTKEDLEAMSDEEWQAFMAEITPADRNRYPNKYENWWIDGPFAFDIHIEADRESNQIITVDETNDTGAGLYQVAKTRFEITVEEKCSEERAAKGVFAVVLDADGELLPSGGSSFADTYAINGRDVSCVYVYICDFDEYMDEIKGHRKDADFQDVLEKRALYKKKVTFER